MTLFSLFMSCSQFLVIKFTLESFKLSVMATRTDLTSESSEMNEAGQKESDVINCVVFYYEKGTSGNIFVLCGLIVDLFHKNLYSK